MIRLALALLLLACPAEARWVAADGDTIIESATLEKVRVMGVDTAEMKARCQAELDLARAAKAFTAQALERGPVTLERGRLDKYGRTLALVRIDGRDLAEMLIGAGLGRRYSGGKREGWCR